ncbi:DUF559 domain-containing protein [Corynebacterium diphtheriae]|nr:hypothetical protein B1A65_08360 [Corynebacterium diphtheriae]OSQ19791.1 hypothetical protein B1A51_11695 [Corynebacterium diphtheriae]RKW98449.1 DUF559 domain-containing protein [Corynebacterium diphtheriae]RKX00398.1 DUF559 domain-containing protein [Corynebacterium diphtheriae]
MEDTGAPRQGRRRGGNGGGEQGRGMYIMVCKLGKEGASVGGGCQNERMHTGDWKTALRAEFIDVRDCVNVNSQVRERLETGELVRLSSGVAVPVSIMKGLPRYQRQWARSFCVGMGARAAVVTGRAAAHLLGMWTVNAPMPEVTMLAKHPPPKSKQQPGVRYVRAPLRRDEVVRGRHLNTTTPYRTFLEIAREAGFVHALVAADWLLYSRTMVPAQLQHMMRITPRFHGISSARRAVACAVLGPESAPESHARAVLLDAGFRNVLPNVWIESTRYRVDLLVENVLIIEIDGFVKYEGAGVDTTDVLLQEKRRADTLCNLGYELIRFSPNEVARNPAAFLSTVHSALHRARQ